MSILATCSGVPPGIGANRELKKALESFWGNQGTGADLQRSAARLRRRHWSTMKAAGMDHIPAGIFLCTTICWIWPSPSGRSFSGTGALGIP